MLHLSTAPDHNRVNCHELRHLRQVVAATAICCLPTAIQTEVTRAWHEGMDLTQEARVLLLEHAAASQQPTMHVAR